MSEHLDKAKAALTHANDANIDLKNQEKLPVLYTRLLTLARVQAEIAQADALERIADVLENEVKLGGAFHHV